MPDPELQKSGLQPTAQPVSTFLQFQQQNIAEPARPAGMPQGQGISQMQRMGTPNLQGYNQASQLAEALAPFSSKLMEITQKGVEMYASSQYQQGQNEAAKAALNLDRQMAASENAYAADNRALAKVDSIAGLTMDTVNPYRAAGRQRKLSELAAYEVGPAIQRSYLENAGDYAQLENNDPKLNEVRSKALQQVVQKYSLDTRSPGFMDLVLPKANHAWEQVQMKQMKDRQAYLKDTMPRTDGVQILGMLTSSEGDANLQREWAGGILTNGTKKLGLPGEGMDYQRKAIEHAVGLAVANGRSDLVPRIGTLPVGPVQVDKNGNPFQANAAQMFGPDMFLQMDKFSSIVRKNKDEQSKQLGDSYSNDLAIVALSIPEGPGRADAINAVRNKPAYQALSLSDKLKAEENINGLVNKSQSVGDNTEGMTGLLSNMQTRYGSAWNVRTADQEFGDALSQIQSTDARQKFREQYQAIRKSQDSLSNSTPAGPVDQAIRDSVKATLVAKYPDMQAALTTGNQQAINDAISGVSKTNAAVAATKLSGAFRTAIYAALGDAMAKKGGKLSNLEQQTIIQDTLKDYEAKHKDTYPLLLPGIGSTPSVIKTQPSAPDPSKQPAVVPKGQKAQVDPRFDVNSLDNIPNRDKRLKDPGAVLNFASTADAVGAALNNEPLPAALKRAAKDAGMTPEAFILKQVDAYPDNLNISPQQRQQLLKQGNKNKALNNYNTSSNRPSQGEAIQTAMNWLTNSLLGISPASAAGVGGNGQWASRPASSGWASRDNRGQSLIAMAGRLGVSPADIAAIFSYETGGTLNPNEPGIGAARGRIGLIQAGPNERLAYGLGTGNWESEMKGVEKYMKARGVKPGMGLPDLYAAVNGGNVKAGYTPDGNQVVARSASTQKALQQHRTQAMAKLGLNQEPQLPVNAGLEQFSRAKPVPQYLITSGFGNQESFRKHQHEGADVGFTSSTKLGFKMGGTVLNVARTNSRAAEANGGYGNFIDVRLDNGQIVRMAHLKEIPQGLIKGGKFGANQIVAKSGGRKGDIGTGRSTGDHLHIEEHSIRQGINETTRGKLNPNRSGGAMSHLIWE